MIFRFLILLLVLFSPSVLSEISSDALLELAIEVHNLKPKDCEDLQYSEITSEEVEVGKLLFESKLLSGNKDTSCSQCHIDEFGSSDGLPISVGVGGDGEGLDRMYHGKGVLVQRNSFSLFGRGSKDFVNYFWDGKLDASNGEIVSQFGDGLIAKLEEPLTVASVLPLIERDEFLGKRSSLYENDFLRSVGDKLYDQRYYAVSDVIRKRIRTDADAVELKEALLSVDVDVDRVELLDIGKLIGKFIAVNFQCEKSPWDAYLSGDLEALTESQKQGALLFYGKARCSVCHSGKLQSDFDYHSIGVPQRDFGPHSRRRDLGRAAVTLDQEDLFKFRTPPLLGVKDTAPYGHNGAFSTLESVIVHHVNPLEHFLNRDEVYNKFSYGRVHDSRDEILSAITINGQKELDKLVKFLEAL
jgi:cytochrome c peroxidase